MAIRSSDVAEMAVRELFALNVLVQLADGTLTYSGISLGFVEGNPLLEASMATLGVGTALLLYKAYACGLLVVVRRSLPPVFSTPLLTGTAVATTLAALVPWIGKFASLAALL